jgi:tryptophan-rich sensory protein
MFNRDSWLSLMPFLAVCFATAGLGSWVTKRSVHTWYPQLQKPEWNPPNWMFAPVWTFLYTLMALSAWLVWKQAGWQGARGALILFGIQLLLNSSWSLIFFGMHAIGAAFADILFLWTITVATAVAFYAISFLAAWLLIPYIAWVGFASYLNFRIWQMN